MVDNEQHHAVMDLSALPRQDARAVRPHPRPQRVVRLLRTFELRVDGELVSLPPGPQRLIAVLALRGCCGRSRLAGSLWPETTEHRALASLRTGIWRVNLAAPGLIVPSHHIVDLNPEVDVDVHRLLAAAHAVMLNDLSGAVGAIPPREDWGELLPDWEDEWLTTDRERLRQLRLHVLEAQAEQLSQSGAYGLALEFALAVVRADELRESGHRVVIKIHLAEGNLIEARRAYDQCAALLASEIGVPPSEATTALLPAQLMADRRLPASAERPGYF